MGQSVWQMARRRALEAQARQRRARAEAERRRSALAIGVVVALSERDGAIERYERAAGAALVRLTDEEGLTITEDQFRATLGQHENQKSSLFATNVQQ